MPENTTTERRSESTKDAPVETAIFSTIMRHKRQGQPILLVEYLSIVQLEPVLSNAAPNKGAAFKLQSTVLKNG